MFLLCKLPKTIYIILNLTNEKKKLQNNMLGIGCPGFNPRQDPEYFSSQPCPEPFWQPSSPQSNSIRGTFPRDKPDAM
jgi:hypothetical protein